MSKRKFLIFLSLVWALAVVPMGIDRAAAQQLQVGPNGYLIRIISVTHPTGPSARRWRVCRPRCRFGFRRGQDSHRSQRHCVVSGKRILPHWTCRIQPADAQWLLNPTRLRGYVQLCHWTGKGLIHWEYLHRYSSL